MIQQSIIVKSTRKTDGSRFRPSDWVERLASNGAYFDTQRRLHWHADLYPVYINGEKCLRIGERLASTQPGLWQHVLAFVTENQLEIANTAASGEDATVEYTDVQAA